MRTEGGRCRFWLLLARDLRLKDDMDEPGFWRALNLSGNALGYIDQCFQREMARDSRALPDLRSAPTILIASDYSGEHSGASYHVLSFILADVARLQEWDRRRRELRAEFLSNNRRMSFKALRDKQRQRALQPFLLAANTIPGLSLTVAIDSSIESVFPGSTPLNLIHPDFESFAQWTPRTLEKASRIVHLLAVMVAGLGDSGQNVVWITDEDPIAANPDRLILLTNLFAWVSSTYLTFDMGHFRCGTTANDDGSNSLEDLAAVPDLIAGAIGEQLQLASVEGCDASKIFWLHRGDFTRKTSFITLWLADSKQPLKRYFLKIDGVLDSSEFKWSWFHFHDQQ
jgi:hypothetical protein